MSTITFVPTQRGGTALLFDGYRYNKVRCNNDKNVTYWRCSKNRNCPGRAVTVDNRVKKTNNKHNHAPENPVLPHHHALHHHHTAAHHHLGAHHHQAQLALHNHKLMQHLTGGAHAPPTPAVTGAANNNSNNNNNVSSNSNHAAQQFAAAVAASQRQDQYASAHQAAVAAALANIRAATANIHHQHRSNNINNHQNSNTLIDRPALGLSPSLPGSVQDDRRHQLLSSTSGNNLIGAPGASGSVNGPSSQAAAASALLQTLVGSGAYQNFDDSIQMQLARLGNLANTLANQQQQQQQQSLRNHSQVPGGNRQNFEHQASGPNNQPSGSAGLISGSVAETLRNLRQQGAFGSAHKSGQQLFETNNRSSDDSTTSQNTHRSIKDEPGSIDNHRANNHQESERGSRHSPASSVASSGALSQNSSKANSSSSNNNNNHHHQSAGSAQHRYRQLAQDDPLNRLSSLSRDPTNETRAASGDELHRNAVATDDNNFDAGDITTREASKLTGIEPHDLATAAAAMLAASMHANYIANNQQRNNSEHRTDGANINHHTSINGQASLMDLNSHGYASKMIATLGEILARQRFGENQQQNHADDYPRSTLNADEQMRADYAKKADNDCCLDDNRAERDSLASSITTDCEESGAFDSTPLAPTTNQLKRERNRSEPDSCDDNLQGSLSDSELMLSKGNILPKRKKLKTSLGSLFINKKDNNRRLPAYENEHQTGTRLDNGGTTSSHNHDEIVGSITNGIERDNEEPDDAVSDDWSCSSEDNEFGDTTRKLSRVSVTSLDLSAKNEKSRYSLDETTAVPNPLTVKPRQSVRPNFDQSIMASAAPSTGHLLKRLRSLMSAAHINIGAYIVPSGDAHQSEYIAECDKRREFISKFTGSAGTAIITDQLAALWTDGRYYLQASQQLDLKNWTLMKDGLPDTLSQGDWLCKTLPAGARVGVDPYLLSADGWAQLSNELKSNEISLVSVNDNLIDQVWADQSCHEPGVDIERAERPCNPLLSLDIKITGKSWQDKIDELRQDLKKKDATSIVLTALDDVAWLFNVRGSDVEYNPVFFAYSIVTMTDIYLFIDKAKLNPEIEAFLNVRHVTMDSLEEVNASGTDMIINVLPYDEVKRFVDERLANQPNKVWVSQRSSYAIVNSVPESKRVMFPSPVTAAKAIKNEIEINNMKHAHVKDAAALCEYLAWLEKAVESQLDSPAEFGPADEPLREISGADYLESCRRAQEGYMGLSFPTISSVGPNGSVIHYHPAPETNRAITKNELYLVDSGAQYMDGTTDVTRTIHLGQPTQFERECFTRVLKGHITLAMTIFPRALRGVMLDSFARRALWSVGLDYLHGTGHGVGMFLNVHEGPSGISFRGYPDDPGLQEGAILSNEPGYYEDGCFGIRIESLVVIRKAELRFNHKDRGFLRFETITLVPIQKKMIDTSLLTTEEIRWLNDYHSTCREVVGAYLDKLGKQDVKRWLERETEPIALH